MEHFRNYQGGSQGGGSRHTGGSGVRRSGGGYRRPVVRQTSTSHTLGGTAGGPWWVGNMDIIYHTTILSLNIIHMFHMFLMK